MRASRFSVTFAAAVAVSAASLGAQSPVAVPIVGSPAAGQQPPAALPVVPFIPPQAPLVTPPAGPRSGPRKLDMTFDRGTIGLDARNVTLREILTEWQRRGGCQFVNVEKLSGGPITRQFPAGTPELVVLDSLLRELATPSTGYGYMVGPPSTERAQHQSMCGAVYIVPMSRPTASAATYAPVSSPIAAPLVTGGSPDDEIPPVVPFPPPIPPQPRPAVPQPGQPGGGEAPAQPNTPPPSNAGFGPVAPAAVAPGRTATPPGQQGGGRGGNQAP